MADGSEIVQRWLALWNRDVEELKTLVANDIVVHAMPAGQGIERPLVGLEALHSWTTSAQAMLPAIRFSIEVGPLIDDALIAIRWRGEGPHGQRHVSFTGTDFLRIAGGRIAELWTNADTMLMLQQIELLPSAYGKADNAS